MRHALLLITFALTACQSSPANQRLYSSYDALATREAAHVEATRGSDDADEIHDETASYCADMTSDADEMERACDEMMGGMGGMGGGMDGDDQERLRGALDDLRAEVDRHCANADELEDADTLQGECDEHDVEMNVYLDTLHGELPDGSDGI